MVKIDLFVWNGGLFIGKWRWRCEWWRGKTETKVRVEGRSGQVDGSCTWSKTKDRREEYSFRGTSFISLSYSLINYFPISSFFCFSQKLVARKARKFQSQNQHLALPALELAYIFHGIAHAPRTVIVNKMLPEVEILLTALNKTKEDIAGYVGGRGSYWDDYCLGMFLKGVCMRYVAYPVSFGSNCVVMWFEHFYFFFLSFFLSFVRSLP